MILSATMTPPEDSRFAWFQTERVTAVPKDSRQWTELNHYWLLVCYVLYECMTHGLIQLGSNTITNVHLPNVHYGLFSSPSSEWNHSDLLHTVPPVNITK